MDLFFCQREILELKQNYEKQINEHEKQLNIERIEHQEHIQVNISYLKILDYHFLI